jgi:Wadjet anti plasmid transformation system JetA-like protein
MPGPPPRLFDRVPRGLFGPLGDPYAELYWELLAELYRLEFEREPFVVVRSTALDVAEDVIRGSRLWSERRQELEALAIEGILPPGRALPPDKEVDEAGALRALARRLVARLEESEWMHFQYRGGVGEIMSFHAYAARILQTLLDVARDEQPVFQGLVHSIAALLEPKAFAQRPGVSLSEARRHTLELSRELKILERNIHLFIQRVLDEAATAAAVLEEGFERYEHAVMANYHRLKTVDNVYRQRSAILQRLDAIEQDRAALEYAAEWYAAQRGVGPDEGALAVKSELELLRSHFDNIPRLVDDIDTRNARFSGVALRRIRYFLRQDRRTEGQLQFIVDALARDDVPELEFDAFKCELLADNFLYTPPTARQSAAPQRLVPQAPANRERIREEAAARVRRIFARRRIEEFVHGVLAGRDAAPMRDVPVGGDQEYVRLLYLASYGLDGDSTFRIVPSDGRVQRDPYGYPDGTVERVRSKKRRSA